MTGVILESLTVLSAEHLGFTKQWTSADGEMCCCDLHHLSAGNRHVQKALRAGIVRHMKTEHLHLTIRIGTTAFLVAVGLNALAQQPLLLDEPLGILAFWLPDLVYFHLAPAPHLAWLSDFAAHFLQAIVMVVVAHALIRKVGQGRRAAAHVESAKESRPSGGQSKYARAGK